MSFIPQRPFGDDEEARGLQTLWDREFDPQTKIFRDTPQTKWDKNADGTHTLNVKLPTSAPAPPQNFYPFKVYQPPQSAFAKAGIIQGTTFDVSGNPLPINIDSTKPTDFTASPQTVNPNTDYWRLWMVRNGLVEVRALYSASADFFTVFSTYNNNSPQLDIFYGTDGYSPLGATAIVYTPATIGLTYDSTDTSSGVAAGYFRTDGHTSFNYPDGNIYQGVIVIPSDAGVLGIGYGFVLWIDILPDANSSEFPLPRIKGRRWQGNGGGPFIQNLNPSGGSLQIPIAHIDSINGPDNYSQFPLIVTQILTGHCLNRWPAAMYGANAIGALSWRGHWQNDVAIQDQIFYPGDVITFDFVLADGVPVSMSSPTVLGEAAQELQFMCAVTGHTTDPFTDPNFKQIGSGFTDIQPYP